VVCCTIYPDESLYGSGGISLLAPNDYDNDNDHPQQACSWSAEPCGGQLPARVLGVCVVCSDSRKRFGYWSTSYCCL